MKKIKLRAIKCGQVCRLYDFNCNECPEFTGIYDGISCGSFDRQPNADEPYKTIDGKYIFRRVKE